MNAKKKSFTLLIVIFAVALLCVLWWLSLRHIQFKDVQSYTLQMQSVAQTHLLITTALLFFIQAAGMFFTLPTKAVFNMVAGALLGFFPGALVTIAGTLVGTSGLFWVSRKITPDNIFEKLPPLLKRFEQKLLTRPTLTLASLRLILALPYGAITIFAAISGIRFRPFIIGSFLGDIPVVLLYSAAGLQLADLASAKDALSPTSIAVLTVAGVGLFAGVLWPSRAKKTTRP
ncbi:MAG: VTT domain-containing protein [Deltaproteobacteria bacterium]|nr:VTT domain-containing protein [Deltaproteobacteria bacterium]MBN2674789.1 VTT domain-containing protein [Deltaproteobacteria bacterium]